jgi:diphthamide biosynthesis protein 2
LFFCFLLVRTSHLPVLYVFGQQEMDLDDAMTQFESLLPDHAQPILLMCNVEYAHATGKRRKRATHGYS